MSDPNKNNVDATIAAQNANITKRKRREGERSWSKQARFRAKAKENRNVG